MQPNILTFGKTMSDVFETKALPKPVDTQAALIEALTALHSMLAEHALIGGLAISYYGLERYTKDVDFVVGIETTARATAQFHRTQSQALRYRWLALAVSERYRFLHDKEPKPLRIGGISILTSSGAC
jgi:hypothetical protein